MVTMYACQRCSQLPPPPPIFSVAPPPSLLSVEGHCSPSRKGPVVTSSSPSISILLGFIITLLISSITILLIKNQRRKRRMVTTSTVNFSRTDPRQTSTKFLPLLSDSCSSDQMSSTPSNDYPSGHSLQHEYEQIDDYCLVYCRSCANYHPTSCSRSYYLPVRTNPSCQQTCRCQDIPPV